MDLLLLALLVALTAWTARRLREWWKRSVHRRARAAMPGASADNPLILRSVRVLEEARSQLRCDCGGLVQELGETSRAGMRVARGRCVDCDADVDLYLVLPHLLN